MQRLNYDIIHTIVPYLDLAALKATSLVNSILYSFTLPYIRQSIALTCKDKDSITERLSEMTMFMTRPDRVPYIRKINISFEQIPSGSTSFSLKNPITDQLFAALQALPVLGYLRFCLGGNLGPEFGPLFNKAVLSSTLCTFDTDYQYLAEFLEHHPQLTTIIARGTTDSLIGNTPPKLQRLAVEHINLLQQFHRSPIHDLVILDGDSFNDPYSFFRVAHLVGQSPAPIRRLSIGYISKLTVEKVSYYGIRLFTDLEYLRVAHGNTVFMFSPRRRAITFEVLRMLKQLKEVVWDGDSSEALQKVFIEQCAPTCPALRKVTMSTLVPAQNPADQCRLKRTVYERGEEASIWVISRESTEVVSEMPWTRRDGEPIFL